LEEVEMKLSSNYSIDIQGNVQNTKTKRILQPNRIGAGYLAVKLEGGQTYYVHRLVARCFLPAPTCPKCEVDHIDRNKENNHASNLRWVSKQENLRNRGIEMKPRKGNSFGHHHVSSCVIREKPMFRVVFNRFYLRHYSVHETLEEALTKRDEVIRDALYLEKKAEV
jgi:hypothetical protein